MYWSNLSTVGGKDDSDSDSDGLSNFIEQRIGTLPLVPDTDADGTIDEQEMKAATDPLEWADTDGDGVKDNVDKCAGTPKGESPNAEGCSASQADSDGDGVFDGKDQCSNTLAGVNIDSNGCLIIKGDTNRDDVIDLKDSQP